MAETDRTSFDHAQATLARNRIPKERIELVKAISTEMILLQLKERSVDVVICNPPFYASRQELEEGMNIKAVGPHAVS
jgi:methyltransferase